MAKKDGFHINSMIVLALLQESERHGVEIAKEFKRRSSSHLNCQPGTLYPLLHQLEKQGHVESRWEQPENERARRVYSLTDKGRAEVEHLLMAWNKHMEAVQRILMGPSAQENAFAGVI